MKSTKEEMKLLDRLKKRSDFLRVQKLSKENQTKWVSKGMVIELAPNEDGKLRYGLTVSKRVSKLAVERNRVKRRLRAVVREVLPAYAKAGHHLDIVVIGRLNTLKYDYEALKNDLVWCLKRLGIEKSKA
ncbi:MAG: ribonuclease P protein component [Alphaproteobacteria bacterium]|nr:ribonuclease P protein component [Alphaproteobacteria bacterium]